MTANFSFKRLFLLITKQWIENRRLYLMSALALIGILGAAFALWLSMAGTRYEEGSMYVMGMIGLFINGAIFASTSFNMLNSKDTGIYWISFPASHFEKFLATWFFNFVVFSIAYLLCFLLLKTAAEAYVQTLINENPVKYGYKKLDWKNENGLGAVIPNFISAFFVVQAAFLLGSAAFKRFAFIITIVLIAAFLFLFIYYVSKVANYGFPDHNWNLFSLRENYVRGNDTYKEYQTSPIIKEGTLFFLRFLIAPVLWFITWIKLKEKQI